MAETFTEARAALQSVGLSVTSSWGRSAEQAAQRIDPSWPGASAERKLDLLVAIFLECDLNVAGDGSLPPNVETLHSQKLHGRHVLQLDEVVDISKPVKERYLEGGSGGGQARCLKISLTDGVQRVAAVEYRPIPALSPNAPAGLKIAVTDAMVRRGVLLLRPENVQVLGGKADRLERARQALWQHCNRPLSARAAAETSGAVEAMKRAAWEWEEGIAGAEHQQQQRRNQGPSPSLSEQQQHPHQGPSPSLPQQPPQQQQSHNQGPAPSIEQQQQRRQALLTEGQRQGPVAAGPSGDQQQQQQPPLPQNAAPSFPQQRRQQPLAQVEPLEDDDPFFQPTAAESRAASALQPQPAVAAAAAQSSGPSTSRHLQQQQQQQWPPPRRRQLQQHQQQQQEEEPEQQQWPPPRRRQLQQQQQQGEEPEHQQWPPPRRQQLQQQQEKQGGFERPLQRVEMVSQVSSSLSLSPFTGESPLGRPRHAPASAAAGATAAGGMRGAAAAARPRSKLSLSLSQRPQAAPVSGSSHGYGHSSGGAQAPSGRDGGASSITGAQGSAATQLLPAKRPARESLMQQPQREAPAVRISGGSSSPICIDGSDSDLEDNEQIRPFSLTQGRPSPMDVDTTPDSSLPDEQLQAPWTSANPQVNPSVSAPQHQQGISPVSALTAIRTPHQMASSTPKNAADASASTSASVTAMSSCRRRALSMSSPATPALGAGPPVPCLRAFTEMQAKMPADRRPLRPKPIHAVLLGTDGRLSCRDDYGNALDSFKLAVFLDDGTARRRCLVDSRLVEKWLGGKGPADIAPYDDSDPRRAELLAPVRSLLQKAEGMWRLEIRGGGADVPPVIIDMEPGIDHATVETLRRSCAQLYPPRGMSFGEEAAGAAAGHRRGAPGLRIYSCPDHSSSVSPSRRRG